MCSRTIQVQVILTFSVPARPSVPAEPILPLDSVPGKFSALATIFRVMFIEILHANFATNRGCVPLPLDP